MKFPERLVTLRKQKAFTQQVLADAIGLNVSQLKRYEGGTSQPTLEVLRKLSIALGVSADALIFEENERGPDDDLRLQFEAISRFDPEERKVVKTLLDSLILKHEARRWSTG
jgi:transcriptional regulator with XRE-family HTH domain